MIFVTSEESFSLDELVLRLKKLFEERAYCSILHTFLNFLQSSLIAQVDDEEKKRIRELVNSSEAEMDRLITELKNKGYDIAVNYLSRAANSMFGYMKRWLRAGLIGYKASSMVERVMRAIGRRIKKIAYGWKERGVCKMAKILLKRFADEAEWKRYWDKVCFSTTPRVAVTFKITEGAKSSHNF